MGETAIGEGGVSEQLKPKNAAPDYERPSNRGYPETDNRTDGQKSHDAYRWRNGPWGPVWDNLSRRAQRKWENRAAQESVYGTGFEPLTIAFFEQRKNAISWFGVFWRRARVFRK